LFLQQVPRVSDLNHMPLCGLPESQASDPGLLKRRAA
jgi:hypothetical protein